MRCACLFALLAMLNILTDARGQTPEDIAKLIPRILDLDSMDLTRQEVKYRPGLEPMLLAFDADESGMTVLKDPFAVQGQGKLRATGWYRLRFVAPEKLGNIARPAKTPGYAIGIESNVLGSWEIYTYVNGQRAGGNGTGAIGAPRWVKAANEPATVWRSNAQLYAKPGEPVTVVILAMSSPLGESVEGYGLRHVRLRFAGSHTGQRQLFFNSLHNVRDRLAKAKGDELKVLQDKLKGPLARLDALEKAAETGDLETFSKAMSAASKEINDALMK